MNYRTLGESGLKVSPICLGTMMFGSETDEKAADQITGRAREAGVNFIDTADVYALGESERVTGKVIAADRDKWVLGTKVSIPFGEDPNEGGHSRKWIRHGVEASLSRLGTDYIDILYLHLDGLDTPLEETFGAIDTLMRAGKLLYFGISNFAGWRIAEAVRVCESLGMPRPVVCQPNYSMVSRVAEAEILPACSYYGIGVASYSPLARGVLTGKYKDIKAPPSGSRAARKDMRMMQTEFRQESLKVANKIVAHAEQRKMTPVSFALNWVLNNEAISSVIAGPKTLEQWEDYIAALDDSWHADDEAFVDELIAPGHNSTPGYTDPQYPVRGRVTKAG